MMDLHCCETNTEILAQVDVKLLKDDRVLKNMLKIEERYTPMCTEINCAVQTEITPIMRGIVSEWMMEVCDEQKCQDEVFLLAMNYFNRFLLVCSIRKNQLQLLGAACMLLASKYREPRPLTAEMLVYYTDHSITKEMLWGWELLVLSRLKWDIAAVVPNDFLPHLLKGLPITTTTTQTGIKYETVKSHAKILITLCAKEYDFAHVLPSVVACASVASALCGLGWTNKSSETMNDVLERLNEQTNVDVEYIKECMVKIEKLIEDTSSTIGTTFNDNSEIRNMERREESSPPPDKMCGYKETAVTPTDVHSVHF